MPEPDDYDARDRPHLSFNAFRDVVDYSFPSKAQKRKPLREDYAAHAEALHGQLNEALGDLPSPASDQRLHLEGLKPGANIEISTLPLAEGSRSRAAKIPATLEFPTQDIVVLRTQRRDDRTESALLFIPDESRGFLRDRITRYGNDPGNARRPDVDKFEVIETINSVSARSLFVGSVDFTAPTPVWWELWLPGGAVRVQRLVTLAANAELDVHSDRLTFPDTTIVFIHAPADAVERFAARVPGAIAEIHRATGSIELFLSEEEGAIGQEDWTAELKERVIDAPDDANVVCVLDTGVAAQHSLLVPGLKGAWAYDAQWGTDDHIPHGGHGTALAGLVLYGDLEPLMNDTVPVVLTHGAESMKLLPPAGFPPTKPPSYGIVTQGSVALVETNRPNILRTYCIANSTTDFPAGRPSPWSGAVDQIAAGAMPGEAMDGETASNSPKRLMLVATGNVLGGSIHDVLAPHSLEDPSQSWNALTIGGFTRKEIEPAAPPTLKPVVPANHRSPFSCGSSTLPDDLTPIKPEVLFEAGNMLADSSGFCAWHEAVSLLAPGSGNGSGLLVPFCATSAAVGVAGHFLGQLQSALPGYWPETHRALTVDSAQWPQPIRKQLIGSGAHWKSISKAKRQQLLREVGYGVPNIERAIASARNDVTMIAESEIQPYAIGSDGRSGVFNEMHFYSLPWPRAALEQLENELVTMKVTLSYFIEPNLTGRAATRPDTYRSFGLRFAMKKRDETQGAFRARINSAQEADGAAASDETDYWLLGSKAIQAGSLHCDLWRGRAIELARHNAIAVFPVGGWWKSHAGQRRMTDTCRYTLVISISAPGQVVDLHTEIATLVEVRAIETPI